MGSMEFRRPWSGASRGESVSPDRRSLEGHSRTVQRRSALGDKRARMTGTLGLANFTTWFDVPLVVQFSSCHLARSTLIVCRGLAE